MGFLSAIRMGTTASSCPQQQCKWRQLLLAYSLAFPEQYSLSTAKNRTSEVRDSKQSFVRRTGGKNGKRINSVPGRVGASLTEGLLLRNLTLLTGTMGRASILWVSISSRLCLVCAMFFSLCDRVILLYPFVFLGMLNLPCASHLCLSLRYLGVLFLMKTHPIQLKSTLSTYWGGGKEPRT